MSELRDKYGKVIAVLKPEDGPFTFSQMVYKSYGTFERTYVLKYNIVGEKVTGIQLNTK